jgi:O-antigen/teichoic acid export membrane protein
MSVERSSITVFLSQIGATIAGFLSLMYFAHVLGPEILGIYFVYIAIFNLIVMFMDCGLNSGTIKRISEGREASEYFTASLLMHSATLLLFLAALYVMRGWIDDYIGVSVFHFLALSLLFMRYSQLIRAALAGEKKQGISYLIYLAENIARIIFQLIFITLGYQIYGMIGGFCIALLVNLPLGLKFTGARLKKPSMEHVKSIFSYSKYSFGISLNEYLYQSMDILVIGLLMPKFYSGVYGVSWSFSNAAILGTIAISTTLFPYISGWSANGQIDQIKNAFSEALTYSLMLAIPAFAGVLIFSGDLLYYAYGEAFTVAWLTLIILTGARLVETVQMITRGALAGMNRPDLVLKVTLVTIPLNLIGNFVLVYAIGIVGAAIATFATIAVSLKLSLKYSEGIVPISIPWKDIRDESLSALFMILILLIGLHFVHVNRYEILGAYTAIGAAVYFTTLITINEKIRVKMISIFRVLIKKPS